SIEIVGSRQAAAGKDCQGGYFERDQTALVFRGDFQFLFAGHEHKVQNDVCPNRPRHGHSDPHYHADPGNRTSQGRGLLTPHKLRIAALPSGQKSAGMKNRQWLPYQRTNESASCAKSGMQDKLTIFCEGIESCIVPSGQNIKMLEPKEYGVI